MEIYIGCYNIYLMQRLPDFLDIGSKKFEGIDGFTDKFKKFLIMLQMLNNIPNVKMDSLPYVMETMKYQHAPDTLWLEFGVATGRTINYISTFTDQTVYGFDSFYGLPEDWRINCGKGCFNQDGQAPNVSSNVVLVHGMFQDTLPDFMRNQGKKVSFIHIDCDLYSSTKCILNNVRDYLADECIIVFDELVNYSEFYGDTGELKAFVEFICENDKKYEWIGMNGVPMDMTGYSKENVAVRVFS